MCICSMPPTYDKQTRKLIRNLSATLRNEDARHLASSFFLLLCKDLCFTMEFFNYVGGLVTTTSQERYRILSVTGSISKECKLSCLLFEVGIVGHITFELHG